MTSIGSDAFYYCTSLRGTLTIPNSVTSIGSYAFCGCSGLTGELIIPNSVTSIGEYAFGECSGLTGELIIPNSMKTIEQYTFTKCSGLTSVTIPNSVTEIRYHSFSECTGLKSIYSLNPEPPSCNVGAFDYIGTTCVLYVPTQAVSAYSTADTWKNFKNIVGIDVYIAPTVQTYEATDITYNAATLSGSVTVGSEEIEEYGFEYWAEGGKIQTIAMSNNLMGATVTGLEQSTTYTYRAYATTASGTTYGEEMTFTTRAITAPTVQTYEATNISDNSASLSGLVTVGDEELLEQGFEYWAEGGEIQTIAMADQMMAVTITGLNEGTTYTYRTYATTESGTTYGEEMTFTTIKAPTVNTSSATYISEDSATLNGSVTVGNEEILEQGFEYWVKGGEIQTITMSDQLMTITLTGLVSGTTYTYRAYAATSSGTTYGEEVSFTTLGLTPPTVLTYEATDITGNSATLKGAIRVGDEEILVHGFEYWTGDDDVQTITSTKDYMSETVTGLKLSTTYTYRAYAKTASGTTYGENVSFTTLDYADGVSNVNAELEVEARYTTDGKKMSQPQRGINIVHYLDGTVRKVLVK